MTAKDWVGLAVRVVGFWVIVKAAILLLGSFPYLHDSQQSTLSAWDIFMSLWLKLIAMLIFGGWMLFKADVFTRLVCRVQAGRQQK